MASQSPASAAMDAGNGHPLALHLASLRSSLAHYEECAHAAASRLHGMALKVQLAQESEKRSESLRQVLEQEVLELRKREAERRNDTSGLELKNTTLLLEQARLDLDVSQQRCTSLTLSQSRTQHALELTQSSLSQCQQEHHLSMQKSSKLERENEALQRVVSDYANLVRKLETSRSSSSPTSSVPTSPSTASSDTSTGLSLFWNMLSPSLGTESTPKLDLTFPECEGDHAKLQHKVLELEDKLSARQRDVDALEAMQDDASIQITALHTELSNRESEELSAVKMVQHYTAHASATQRILQNHLVSLQTTINHTDSALSASLVREEKLATALQVQSSELMQESSGRRLAMRIRLEGLGREERISNWILEITKRLDHLAYASTSGLLDNNEHISHLSIVVRQDSESLGLLPCTPSTSTPRIPNEDNVSPLSVISKDPSLARLVLHEDLVISLLEDMEVLSNGKAKLVEQLSSFAKVGSMKVDPREVSRQRSASLLSAALISGQLPESYVGTENSKYDENGRSTPTALDNRLLSPSNSPPRSRALLPSALIDGKQPGSSKRLSLSFPIATVSSQDTPTSKRNSVLIRSKPGRFDGLNTRVARLDLSLDSLRSDVAFTATLTSTPSDLDGSVNNQQEGTLIVAQDLLYITSLLTSCLRDVRRDVEVASGQVSKLELSPTSQCNDHGQQFDKVEYELVQRVECIGRDLVKLEVFAKCIASNLEGFSSSSRPGTPETIYHDADTMSIMNEEFDDETSESPLLQSLLTSSSLKNLKCWSPKTVEESVTLTPKQTIAKRQNLAENSTVNQLQDLELECLPQWRRAVADRKLMASSMYPSLSSLSNGTSLDGHLKTLRTARSSPALGLGLGGSATLWGVGGGVPMQQHYRGNGHHHGSASSSCSVLTDVE